ncbi:GNAT family N-acetyltransferase [Cytobacillus solani]|uniref:GCN5 family acetyltransferase n=1 Tax=Cytobacillus solani TaxID=1637975 RepID=A0A0Q3QNG3_9BACI|nr:GNAT family N-acetyltransferase [Cytobacillus solani]KOP82677.1 GCN5 family acetyltransferase [Bacillus sp. FJAT-21945]KQL19689.1 GCN5 family acetyltransferase [Cytobacillus solani]USK52917.1 GNAT family N-acetyltransferase [Cytobacillus solani]
MIKKIEITNKRNAENVMNIQIPSYEIEAEIIGYFDIPPLKDSIPALMHCGETFIGYYINEELSGVLSFKCEKDIIDIHRLMVHPSHFRKGIAKGLLEYIERNAMGIKTLIVSTGSKNIPAIHFYEKFGFVKTGETVINSQLSLSSFMKKIK